MHQRAWIAWLVLLLALLPACAAPAAATTSTFSPDADAYVLGASPTGNFGTAVALLADNSPQEQSYVRFIVSGTSGVVTDAKLRLFVTNKTTDGPAVHLASSSWTEADITWSNRPEPTGAASDDKGSVPSDAYVELNVTPLVSGDGTYTFAIVATSSDGIDMLSREAMSNPPQLVVTWGGTPPPLECSDGTDNDGDGAIDFPADPGCTAASDGSEAPDPPSPAPGGGQVVMAVGDFTSSATDSEALAVRDLIAAQNPAAILGVGDFQYQDIGSILGGWDQLYGPKPGGLFPLVLPTAGPTHDVTGCTDGRYEAYFGRGAFTPYSVNLGNWHIVSLPSAVYRYDCDPAGVLAWLKADLASDSSLCTLAFWQDPYYTRPTRTHPSEKAVKPWVQALYDDGAEVIVAGSNHNYQRFAPMDPDWNLDAAAGVRGFVVGTGGIGLYRFTGTAPNVEASDDTTFGALKLTLEDNGYTFEFLRAAGGSFTDGPVSTRCH